MLQVAANRNQVLPVKRPPDRYMTATSQVRKAGVTRSRGPSQNTVGSNGEIATRPNSAHNDAPRAIASGQSESLREACTLRASIFLNTTAARRTRITTMQICSAANAGIALIRADRDPKSKNACAIDNTQATTKRELEDTLVAWSFSVTVSKPFAKFSDVMRLQWC